MKKFYIRENDISLIYQYLYPTSQNNENKFQQKFRDFNTRLEVTTKSHVDKYYWNSKIWKSHFQQDMHIKENCRGEYKRHFP